MPEQEAYGIYFAIKKWNYYLQGADIIVRNDHKPLARFLNGKNKNTKINRWGLELASYNITFKWISGAKNKATDCLSRLVELPQKHQKNPNGTKPMLINMVKAVTTRSRTRNTTLVEGAEKQPPLRMDINTDNTPRTEVSKETANNNCEENSRDTSVKEMQSMDPFCKRIMKRLLNKTAPKHELDTFFIHNGLLYRYASDHSKDFCTHNPPLRMDINTDNTPRTEVSKETANNNCEENSRDTSVKEMQSMDPFCKRIMKRLLNKTAPKHELDTFFIHNGLLYRYASDHSKDFCTLVIPKAWRYTILVETHDKMGHQGNNRTYSLIKRQYYWKRMTKDMKDYIQRCLACQQEKAQVQSYPLHMMEIPDRPFDKIAMDLVTDFTESNKGNKHILTIIDLLTGWLEAIPIPNKSADTITKAFIRHYLLRHLCPQFILSDNGTEFKNQTFDRVTINLGIERIFSAPYHPQSNGKPETFHKFLKPTLKKMCAEDQDNWDDYIKQVLGTYRGVPNLTTGESPFFLVYGRDGNEPLHQLLQPLTRFLGNPDSGLLCLDQHQLSLSIAKKYLDDHRFLTAEKMKDRAEPGFKVGDRVYFKNKTPGKWDLKLRAGYRIVRIEGKGCYLYIENQATGKIRSCNVKDVLLEPISELWDVNPEFGRASKFINHPNNLPDFTPDTP